MIPSRTSRNHAQRSGDRARGFLLAWLSLLAFDSGMASQAGEPGSAVLARGEPFLGQLVGIDAHWNVSLEQGGRQRVLAAADLISWGGYRERTGKTQVLLDDTSLIVADVIRVDATHVLVESPLWGRTSIPAERIRALVFRPPAAIQRRDRLLWKLASAEGTQDTLLLDNGDRLTGTVIGAPERPDSLLAPGIRSIQFQHAGGAREVELDVDRLVAAVLHPGSRRQPQPGTQHALVGFRDGSRMLLDRIVADHERLQCLLPGKLKLTTLPRPQSLAGPWESVTAIRLFGPSVSYLSDLQPVAYRFEPYLQTEWPPFLVDRSISGGRLRSAGCIFAKGLSMHSRSRVVYQLDGRFRRFQAALALDEVVGRRGSVLFKVYLEDPAGQWKRAFQSAVVRGGSPPQALDLDVRNARRMALLVDYADRADQRDHANWLGARLLP